ncbi:atherin-like [Hemicordylus capensis]|uniref:atherin-like n=1 Tax=Hemicordylus capensis TaxID=884348 RepID=UPI002303395A|nr:atherin-like [Hemicordylus capensis]
MASLPASAQPMARRGGGAAARSPPPRGAAPASSSPCPPARPRRGGMEAAPRPGSRSPPPPARPGPRQPLRAAPPLLHLLAQQGGEGRAGPGDGLGCCPLPAAARAGPFPSGLTPGEPTSASLLHARASPAGRAGTCFPARSGTPQS